MNKQRKNSIKTELDNLRMIKRSLRFNPPTRENLAKELTASKARIDAIHDAEQSDYEKMSEKQQCSTQGESAEECIALLEDAMDYMDELVSESCMDEEMELTDIGYGMEDVIDLLDDIFNM